MPKSKQEFDAEENKISISTKKKIENGIFLASTNFRFNPRIDRPLSV